jgi:hypothetical protein
MAVARQLLQQMVRALGHGAPAPSPDGSTASVRRRRRGRSQLDLEKTPRDLLFHRMKRGFT